jgi:hypothetical protein
VVPWGGGSELGGGDEGCFSGGGGKGRGGEGVDGGASGEGAVDFGEGGEGVQAVLLPGVGGILMKRRLAVVPSRCDRHGDGVTR